MLLLVAGFLLRFFNFFENCTRPLLGAGTTIEVGVSHSQNNQEKTNREHCDKKYCSPHVLSL
jgi:hypothetical protein